MSKFILNGKEVTKEEFAKGGKSNWLEKPPMATTNTYTEHDPLISEGCGVMKAQVGEARDMIKKHNIAGAAVLDSGQVRFTSRRGRKEFLERRGFNDIDSGWSD